MYFFAKVIHYTYLFALKTTNRRLQDITDIFSLDSLRVIFYWRSSFTMPRLFFLTPSSNFPNL